MFLEKISPLRFFQITAFCFGIAVILIIPPFQVPDEADHFERVFHLADGYFWGQQQDQRLGGNIPESIAQLEAIYLPMKFDYSAKQTATKFAQARPIALNRDVKIFQDFPNTGLYPFTVYLPQIPVVLLGKLFNLKPLFLLYLCRLANFILWVFLISKAIQILPARKWTFAFLALLPASIFINASASGDVVTNSIAFFIIAECYNAIVTKNRKISTTEFAWLALGVGILVLNKFVYTPILFLAFLFPKSAFKKPAHKNIFAISLLCFSLLIITLVHLKTSQLFIPKDQYNPLVKETVTLNEGVDPQAQLQFIINYPIQYFKNASLTFLESAPAVLAHYFGKFGWEKNYLPGWVIGVLFLITLFLFMQKPDLEIPRNAKIIFLAITLLITAAIATTIYMMWSPVGNDRILAVSGRYFIPVFPLLWLSLPGIFNFQYKKQLVMVAVITSLLIGLFSAYLRYY